MQASFPDPILCSSSKPMPQRSDLSMHECTALFNECTALFNQLDKTQIHSESKYPLLPGFSTPTSSSTSLLLDLPSHL